MQRNRASFTSLREVFQIATVQRMNARMHTLANPPIVLAGRGTFTNCRTAGYRVYPDMLALQPVFYI